MKHIDISWIIITGSLSAILIGNALNFLNLWKLGMVLAPIGLIIMIIEMICQGGKP